MKRNHRDFAIARTFAIAPLLLQPVLFYWRVVIAARAHIPYDIEAYHFPTLAYIGACLRHGWLPFWDPNTYGGMPLHADLQSQMFYPPVWLALALGNLSEGRNLFYWVEWLIPAHMALAGVFTYAFLRRLQVRTPAALLGGSAYQLSGFFASQACHLGAICAGAWLPLAIWSLFELKDRLHTRWLAILTSALAMSILCGYAATTIIVCGAAFFYAVAILIRERSSWRPLAGLAAAVLLAAAISAVALIPLLRLTSLSIAANRTDWLTAWGAPLQSLMSLFWPNYYNIFDLALFKLHLNFTLLYVYAGVIPLVLILVAPFRRATWVWLTLTILCAVWMLGENTPVYVPVVSLLPRLIRGAAYAWYAMMAFGFFGAMTAAVALNELLPDQRTAWLWALALLTAADLIHAGANRPMNTSSGGFATVSSEYQYGSKPADLQRLRQLVDTTSPPLRIDYADLWSPGILMSGMFNLPTTDGNIPFMPQRMYRLRELFCATKPSASDLAVAGAESPIFRRNLPVNNFDSPLLRMLNTGYVASLWELPGRTDSIGGLNLRRISHPLPRFFLAPAVHASSGAEETFRLLAEPSFDPEREAIVEGMPTTKQNPGTVKVLSYTPNRVELSVDASGPAFLASSENAYPGWRATVNAQPQPLLLTNGAFRGLALPVGRSRVVMEYRPVDLLPSALLSLAAIMITLALAATAPPQVVVSPQKRTTGI